MFRRNIILVFFIALFWSCNFEEKFVDLDLLSSQNFKEVEIELNCKSACVLDVKTGRILFEKNSSERIPPASMTKIMTARIVLKAAESGIISLNDKITVSKNADYKSLPRDSSLMFIEEGQNLTYLDLLKGLAIPSGNDAAIAVAENLYGSVSLFVEQMNRETKSLNLSNTFFVEPSGYSDQNYTTAKDFAVLTRVFVKEFPQEIKEIFAQKKFAYPKPHNGATSIGLIEQINNNELLQVNFQGITGLKTGFINASGYNLAFSVSRENFDIAGVIMGCRSYDNNVRNASMVRAVDAASLISHIYSTYKLIDLSQIYKVRLGQTRDELCYGKIDKPLYVCLSFAEQARLQARFEGKKAGAKSTGDIVFFLEKKELARRQIEKEWVLKEK